MLTQLLELKRRQERRLRQKIAAGDQRIVHLQNLHSSLETERDGLRQDWRELSEKGRGKLGRLQLHELQQKLDEYYRRDMAIKEEIADILSQQQQWQKDREDLQKQLHQRRIEQEKLIYAQEEGL